MISVVHAHTIDVLPFGAAEVGLQAQMGTVSAHYITFNMYLYSSKFTLSAGGLSWSVETRHSDIRYEHPPNKYPAQRPAA